MILRVRLCLSDASLLLEGVEEVSRGRLVGVVPDVRKRYQLVGEAVGSGRGGRTTGFGIESNL